MIRKCLVTAVCLVLLISLNNPLYAYWQNEKSIYENINITTQEVAIGTFASIFCYKPNNNTLIINNCFKNRYMQKTLDDSYDWKKDEYNNIINRAEIYALTPLNTVIYVKNTPFLVVASNYNLIDHGIPNLNQPLSWALVPMVINYVSAWAFRQNQVVQANDSNFYMAKHYTTDNPLVNRADWNKIEPVTSSNFTTLQHSNITDYRNPIFNTIVRSYIYDSFNTYLVGDVVFFNNTEWIAKTNNTNILPTTQNSWAWNKVK